MTGVMGLVQRSARTSDKALMVMETISMVAQIRRVVVLINHDLTAV